MQYRRLGKTELLVSEIGMGTWQITDDPEWGKGQSEAESRNVLQKFLDLGGNLIDTAWVYGWREEKPDEHPSEELIGRFLHDTLQRDKVILCSKIPPIDQMWPTPAGATMRSTFPRAFIRQCVEDSLKSLKTDVIDVMYFHVWRDEFNDEDDWKEECQKLTQEGKVKFWGLSPNYYTPDGCLKTLDEGFISVVQCIFNLFHQAPIEKLFPSLRKNDVGLIACAPLDEGGLTGTITVDTVFAADDFRGQYFAGERKTELLRRIESLQVLLGEEAQSIPELALRFLLSFSETTSVIPGMRNIHNVDRNVSLSDGMKLSEGLLLELRHHAWERNFYPWAQE